jgi:hypothetical protein
LTNINKIEEVLKEVAFKTREYIASELFDLIKNKSATMSNSDAKELMKDRNKMRA